jgi:hypothetical protein
MILLVQKYARRSTLALMFLLAASANCLFVSYDTNENDDVPPVKVHFCFVASRHATAEKRAIGSANDASSELFKAVLFNEVQSPKFEVQPEVVLTRLSTGSPELVVPLRR